MTYRIAMQAVEQAIHRLQMLADLSDMAASGARVATLLLPEVCSPNSHLVHPLSHCLFLAL